MTACGATRGAAARRVVRRIDCIAGARPNFVKIAPIMRALDASGRVEARLIHTGQHYDEAMNASFFRELGIREPDLNLAVGSGSHTEQTARIMLGLEAPLLARRPELLLVVGDVNSTLAAALVASKLRIPLAHVEAGLRSHDRTMPEEINRLVTDRLSDLLLTTEPEAGVQLMREGIPDERIKLVGNVMIDTLHANLARARPAAETIARYAVDPAFVEAARGGFGLVTVHRPSNVDDGAALAAMLEALAGIATRLPLVFAMHPRTRSRIAAAGLGDRLEGRRVVVTPPLGYLEMIGVMREARLVITDSGGVQEETTALGVPCLTVRDNTERPITIAEGTNVLVGSEPARLIELVLATLAGGGKRGRIPALWDGRAAERVVGHVLDLLDASPTTA